MKRFLPAVAGALVLLTAASAWATDDAPRLGRASLFNRRAVPADGSATSQEPALGRSQGRPSTTSQMIELTALVRGSLVMLKASALEEPRERTGQARPNLVLDRVSHDDPSEAESLSSRLLPENAGRPASMVVDRADVTTEDDR